MKVIGKALVSVMLSVASISANAQDFDGFLNVLSKVPQFFTDWIAKTDQIAASQDKEKFLRISMNIYRDIDKLIIGKKIMVQKIQDGTFNNSYLSELSNYSKLLKNFQSTLAKSDELSKKIGLDALKLSNSLNYDFTKKELLINDILGSNKKEKAINNLNQAITILENSKKNIDEFITALEK